jgi:hypothetical protein
LFLSIMIAAINCRADGKSKSGAVICYNLHFFILNDLVTYRQPTLLFQKSVLDKYDDNTVIPSSIDSGGVVVT